MKILVTGCAGFIGFHLVKTLIERGDTVIGVDSINEYYDVTLKKNRLKQLQHDKNCNLFTFCKNDLSKKIDVEKIFSENDFKRVIHLAATPGVRYSLENPHAYVDSNLVGFVNILEGCRHSEVKHLVYASSSSVYGMNVKQPFSTEDRVDYPISLYAATKKSNELMAHTYSHLYNIPTTGLRLFTVYGPWGRPDMAPVLFADAISKNKTIKVFNNGHMSRDFTYIDDVIKGIEILIRNPPVKVLDRTAYKVYNIGNGNPQSLEEFIKEIEFCLGVVSKKEYLPMQAGDVPQTWADISEIQSLGYKSSIGIKEGVKKFVEWFTNYNKIKQ